MLARFFLDENYNLCYSKFSSFKLREGKQKKKRRKIMRNSFLTLIYPPSEIFIEEAKLFGEGKKAVVNALCKVPPYSFNTKNPLSHVSAENYLQCINQIGYIFVYNLIKGQAIPISLTKDNFILEAERGNFYYRDLRLTFHSLILKGEKFEIRMKLKNFKEINLDQSLVDILVFTIIRTSISGEIAFVYERNNLRR